MGFLGWLLRERREERETIARIAVRAENLDIENQELRIKNEKLKRERGEYNAALEKVLDQLRERIKRMWYGRVEVAGRTYWPGTTGYQMVEPGPIPYEDVVIINQVRSHNYRQSFWDNFANSPAARRMEREADHAVFGFLIGKKDMRDWRGRLEWMFSYGYQMVAF